MTTDLTTVNGAQLTNYPHIDSTAARQFAARLPRGGHPAVDRLVTDSNDAVVVWLVDEPVTGDCEMFAVPEGWHVTKTYVVESGATALKVVRDD